MALSKSAVPWFNSKRGHHGRFPTASAEWKPVGVEPSIAREVGGKVLMGGGSTPPALTMRVREIGPR